MKRLWMWGFLLAAIAMASPGCDRKQQNRGPQFDAGPRAADAGICRFGVHPLHNEGKGTGLGLATVYGIVTQNGGFIRVSSEPGRGSVFAIHLPLLETRAVAIVPEEHGAPAGGGRETILLVEDEPAILAMIRHMLASMGYQVLAARLNARRPELKTIYMSGYTGNVVAVHGILDEGVQLLQKPFSKKDLAHKIRSVLDAPAISRPGTIPGPPG